MSFFTILKLIHKTIFTQQVSFNIEILFHSRKSLFPSLMRLFSPFILHISQRCLHYNFSKCIYFLARNLLNLPCPISRSFSYLCTEVLTPYSSCDVIILLTSLTFHKLPQYVVIGNLKFPTNNINNFLLESTIIYHIRYISSCFS